MFQEIKSSSMSTSRRRLIHGVATNDADYNISTTANGKSIKCPFYNKWREMIRRCYAKESVIKYPSYKGVYVCDEWLLFSNFKSWMIKQDWEGLELDKDIKSNGAKVYSPETCLFLPKNINYLLINCENKKGMFLKGVNFDKRKDSFGASCRTPSGRVHLGYFDTEIEANEAYVSFKKELILSIAKTQPSHIREALENYDLKANV